MDSMPQRETIQKMLCKNYEGFLCFSRIFPSLPDRSEGSGAPGGNKISVEKKQVMYLLLSFLIYSPQCFFLKVITLSGKFSDGGLNNTYN